MAEPKSSMSSLINKLTVEEKASMCVGADFWHAGGVARLGIPALRVSDGPHGLRRQPDEGSQVGIGGSLPATCFPTASALGSSFDPTLARRVGEAMAAEARQQGVAVVLGPGVNIKRSPLCGRNFEYLSEDPLVAGVLAAAMVSGMQSCGVGASLKHFAANNQETDRMRVSADVDERALREIYLPAFERVVTEAHPWTVMCAYNKVNGTYASEHAWLLTEVLRQEWGFEGVVVSDWGAVHDRVAALAAGLDLEMPPHLGVSDVALVAAVHDGTLNEGDLDVAVARLLALVDRSMEAETRPPVSFTPEEHHRLAREAASQSAVLLKNDGDILPLQLRSGQRLAVVGTFAQEARFQSGGSSKVNPTQVDLPLDSLRAAMPDGVEVLFAPGYQLGGSADDGALVTEAIGTARDADVVVAFLGLAEPEEGEGHDRKHIWLPANQRSLLTSLAEVNPNIVVVLANGSAVEVATWEASAKAILECWLGGQAVGGAIADILTGEVNPSGRLAETIPVRLEDNPATLNFPGDEGHVLYGEGVFVGYRAYDKLGTPVSYPFGFGLSYTTFTYSDLQIGQVGSHAQGDLVVTVTCRVTNTGDRGGKEVAQLYVGDRTASVTRPLRELKGFAKITLAPGESQTVTFTLQGRDFSYWSREQRGWFLEAGDFDISVGPSSRDLPVSAVVNIDAPAPRKSLNHMSTLKEWLDDPAGAAALRAAADREPTGQLKELVGNDELVTVIGMFPISTVAAFAGLVVDRDTINDLLAP